MIEPSHLVRYVIRPTLHHLAQWNPRVDSEAAVGLLLLTAAHESQMGRFLHQVKGPAVGIYQMEPATQADLWLWIHGREGLGARVMQLMFPNRDDIEQAAGNLYYATAMARLFYWRRPEALPHAEDLNGLARYAKKWWNTSLGKATIADYETAYRKYVLA